MIETLTATGSTNADVVLRLARSEGFAEGHWLITDRQSAGRGRQGREWFDGSGNFMGSTVVHPRSGDPPRPSLALVAGLAVHDAVSRRLPPPARAVLKWPNDVMIGAAKLAGILLEGAGEAVVIGIGVNLAAAPPVPGRETAALAMYGPAPDRDAFALDLAATFAAGLERWRSYGLAATLSRWSAAAHPPGTPLSVGEAGEIPLSGEFAGLDDSGALLLRLADGTTRTIHAGEVRFAGRA